jgi:plastocyanin
VRKLLLLMSVGMFGVAVGVLPGLATATNQPVQASNSGYTPMQAAIMPGGSVDFANAGGLHDVHFTGSLPSSCTGSTGAVGPASTAPSATPAASTNSWTGTCTFSQAGTYTFICDQHRFSGTVYVNSSGTVPGTTGTTPTTTTTNTTTPSTSTPSPTTTSGHPTQPPTTPTPTPGAPSAGGNPAAASSLRLAPRQRGTAVRGSVTINSSGADFEADLLAGTSQIARSVLVGKAVEHGVAAGRLNFAVTLNRQARGALRRRRRVTLRVKLSITAGSQPGVLLTRRVTLRA